MSLIDAKFVYGTRGYGTDGFTFSVLGDLLPDGSAYLARSQGENPVFTADYSGNPFQAFVEYKFTGQHPDYANDPVLVRYTFDADGNGIPSSPAEDINNSVNAAAQKTLLQLAKESKVALEMPDVLDEMAIDLEEVASRTEFEEADYSDLLATYEINPDKPGKVRIRGLHGNNIWRFLDAYFFGDAVTNLQRKVRYKLSELTETLTTANLSLIEGGNFLKYLSSAIVQGGFYLFQPNANGIGYRVKGLFGQFDGGAVGFADDSGKSVQLQNGTLNTDVIDFHADLSNITIRTSTRVVLPMAKETPRLFTVPEFADYNGNYTDRYASTSQASDALFPDLLVLFQPFLNNGAGASRQTHLEGCVQMMMPPDTTPSKFIIGPDMVGVEQPHNLQTADLFPILLDKNKQPDTTMVLGFSDTVWVITYPPGVTSGYEGGYLRLEPL